mmetsp:Transcript_9902/g.11445  ORF Transcript_9902/g.11445 Transcript_9902/m.11445 type:complete len:511 (+) Transcript_9902:471-2003(+)
MFGGFKRTVKKLSVAKLGSRMSIQEANEEAQQIHKMKLRVLAETDSSSAGSGYTHRTKTGETISTKEYINRLLNEPSTSTLAQAIAHALTLLIIGSVIALILGTCDGYREDDVKWFPVEATFTILFTIELMIRCAVQYDNVQQVFLDVYFYIDFMAVMPFYVEIITGLELPEVIKAVRIVRLFKLARQFQGTITLVAAVQDSLAALTVPGFFLLISGTTFGVLIYYLEKAATSLEPDPLAEARFRSIPEAIWFTFVTMTTVGYGDIVPRSTVCRILNVCAMLFGVLFLSMPLAILGNNFCMVWQDRDRVTLIARIRDALLDGGATKATVKKAFEKIDLDQSGSLNFREFVVAIQVLRIDMSIKKLQRLWKSIDTDGSGEIMVEEFAELVFPDIDMDEDIDDEEELNKKSFNSKKKASQLDLDNLPACFPEGGSSKQLSKPKAEIGAESPRLPGLLPASEKEDIYVETLNSLSMKMDTLHSDFTILNTKLGTLTELLTQYYARPNSPSPTS